MSCEGCKGGLMQDNHLVCHVCDGKYHIECLNMKIDQFESLSKKFRSTRICPSCTNSTRRARSNLNTPVRQNQVPLGEESMDMSCDILDRCELSPPLPQSKELITVDKFNELLNALNVWRTDMNSNMMSIRDDIKDSLKNIQSEIKNLRSEQATIKQSVTDVKSEIKTLQNSVQFQTEDHSSLKKQVDGLAHTVSEQTSTAQSNLEFKIDALEQQARQCNLEICNVPERRNENLMSIVEAIGSAIRSQITQRDIVSVHRVPHAQKGGERPKNIVVKFATRIQRDNILAAYRKTKSLKSDQLGITGTSSTIYMNEHLTLKKKQLFRKIRDAAKELQLKHVWVRNSTILVRERDDSAAIAIRTESDLEKLKASTRK